MPPVDDLKVQAFQIFEGLAAKAGIAPETCTCGAEWIKDDSNQRQIVQRYDGRDGGSVVFKHVARPWDTDRFTAMLAAHQAACNALDDVPGYSVPQILAAEAAQQAYLMRFAKGDTFLDLCRQTEDHAPLLRRAGGWLAAFHGATLQGTHPFQPRFMVNHLHRLVARVESGARRINGKQRFAAYAGRIAEYAPQAQGHAGRIAAKHGDLNGYNLVMASDETAAFDFSATTPSPVGYDIARLLQSYTQMVGDLDALPKGHNVPPAAWDAFFEGYTLVPPDDPTVHFLTRVQILTDWNRIQEHGSIANVMRFERIKKIARQAFA
jgi:tRNA A-37 threonylcarbamoyl transferase component Bud32